MIIEKPTGIYIHCNKCGNNKSKGPICLMSIKSQEFYKTKRTYCGRCIQERIHRKIKNWDYDKEYKINFKVSKVKYMSKYSIIYNKFVKFAKFIINIFKEL